MAEMRGKVLVTDGDQRSALACVRSLGRAGFDCFVLEPSERSLAAASRYCRDAAVAPDPLSDPSGFLKRIEEQLLAWNCDILLPMTEKSLRAVLPIRDELDGVLVPFPSAGVFSAVSDKANVLRKAVSLGMSVPAQWELGDPGELDVAMIPPGAFPLVVKPTRSVVGLGKGPAQGGVGFARDPDELRSIVEEVPSGAFPVLIQERIEGRGAGVFLLLWEGELRAAVGHRRIREKPPAGGVSVARESTAVDPNLLSQSLRLLSELGWRDGVAMVEFKIRNTTEVPYLMEINGRFWGSLQLAIDAGVDFPSLLLRCAYGNAPTAPVLGTPGVTTRWLLGDADHLLLRLFKTRDELDLLDSTPGRLRASLDFLKDFRPGVRNEVLRLSDPFPFLNELSSWFRGLVRSGRKA